MSHIKIRYHYRTYYYKCDNNKQHYINPIKSISYMNYAAHVNQDVNRKSIYVSCFSWNPL